MLPLRRFLLTHCRLAGLLLLLALAMKLVVPTGYMIAVGHDGPEITLCSPPAPRSHSPDMSDMHGMAGHDGPKQHGTGSKDHGKPELPCAFSGLSAQALGGVDPILLVAALAFIAAIASRPETPSALRRETYLRPPLRGPPERL